MSDEFFIESFGYGGLCFMALIWLLTCLLEQTKIDVVGRARIINFARGLDGNVGKRAHACAIII